MGDRLLVSAAERQFITDGVAQDLRNDGRRRDEPRPFRVETQVVPQATGSAKVMLGDTHVIACVKAEIGSPDPARPDEGRIEVAVDCSPTAAPEFQGRGGEELQADLASSLYQSLLGRRSGKSKGGLGELGWHRGRGAAEWDANGAGAEGEGNAEEGASFSLPSTSALDLKQLSLAPGKTCWVLYVDALVLSMDGNVLGAISLAMKAALSDAVLPQVEVVMGEEGEEPQLEILEDGEGGEEGNRLDCSRVPLLVQLSQIGTQYVSDASAEEEAVSSSTVWVSVRSDGHVTSAGQDGAHGVAPSLLTDMLLTASRAAKAWHAELEKQVELAEAQHAEE